MHIQAWHRSPVCYFSVQKANTILQPKKKKKLNVMHTPDFYQPLTTYKSWQREILEKVTDLFSLFLS